MTTDIKPLGASFAGAGRKGRTMLARHEVLDFGAAMCADAERGVLSMSLARAHATARLKKPVR
jgi:hypothetical protein